MMAGKKKRKPPANPARGFATVSLPSKPKELLTAEEEPITLTQPQSNGKQPSTANCGNLTAGGDQSNLRHESSKEIIEMSPEELENHLEEAALQKLIDEHAHQVRDDASRQVTKLKKEKRLLRQQADRTTVTGLTEQLIGHILSSEPLIDTTDTAHSKNRANIGNNDTDILLKIWTLQETLQRLQLPSVDDALLHVLHSWRRSSLSISNELLPGLYEAFIWYAHWISPEKLPDYDTGDIKHKEGVHGQTPANTPADTQMSTLDIPPPLTQTTKFPNEPDQLVRSNYESSDGLSECDDDPSLLVDFWIKSQISIFKLEQSINIDPLASERKRQRILARLRKIEEDPLFEEVSAHEHWRSVLQELKIEAGKANKATRQFRPLAELSKGDEMPQPDDFELGDTLTDMFAEVDVTDGIGSSETQTLLTIRDFGTWSGVHPRQLLEEAVASELREGPAKYKSLAKSDHAVRLQLDLAWHTSPQVDEPSRQSIPEGLQFNNNQGVWSITMEHSATKNSTQGEAYLATIALFLSISSGSVSSKYSQRLPSIWKNIFNDLEETKGNFLRNLSLDNVRHLRDLMRADAFPKSIFTKADAIDRSGQATVKKPTSTRLQRLSAEEAIQRWHRLAKSTAFEEMCARREGLPVFEHKESILQAFEDHQIVIICADTGAGKSTQIPAYILEHRLCQGKDCNIVVTQPRRISAISIARRVSAELGEDKDSLGSLRSLIGYTIRLENKTSLETRLTFATTGVLLRMLQSSPNLDDLDCLVLDEVHERNMDLDLLLIAVKQLLSRRKDLKVVLMSATVDATKFSTYFDQAPILSIPGRTFPVEIGFLEDAIEEISSNLDLNTDHQQAEQNSLGSTDSDDSEVREEAPYGLENYSVATRQTLAKFDHRRLDYELVVKLASTIASVPKYQMYSNAILIFVPGIAEIRRMSNALLSKDLFSVGWIIHMLHSSFSTHDLEQAFLSPPYGYRKIVIATNIAETGITIPDITAVIDTCKEKVMRFDERRQVSRLTEGLISRASARQRRGRAARVREGLCFHLVTKSHFETKMSEQGTPEMLRLGLQDPILRVKIWNLGPIEEVLAAAIDPPSPKNIRRALSKLQDIGALDGAQELTALGATLATLPLDIALGKMAVLGVCFQCLDAIVTIIATFFVKSIFLDDSSTGKTTRDVFERGDSDFLTNYNAYSGWKKARRSGTGQQFCRKFHLSHLQLQLLEEQKIQLLIYLADAKLIILDSSEATALNHARNSRSTGFEIPMRFDRLSSDSVIIAVLALALHPKLLRREGQGYRNVYTNQHLQLAPTSINKTTIRPTKWLYYFEAAQTRQGRLNVFHTSGVSQATLALLIGEAEFDFFSGVVNIDNGRIRLSFRSWRELFSLQQLRLQAHRIIKSFLVKPCSLPQEADQTWLDMMANVLNGSQSQSHRDVRSV